MTAPQVLDELLLEITEAATRIRPFVPQTPLQYSHFLSRRHHCEVLLKLENLQPTGSFKVRGAFNKLRTLTEEQARRGCVTASTGNHGAAMAYAMRELSIQGPIFVPVGTSEQKLALIRSYGGEPRVLGSEAGESESLARAFAEERGFVYVSPYNDLKIIAGQGTIACELESQAGAIDAVFVAVGGGGLVAGIAARMKAVYPKVQIIGCQPEREPLMALSIAAGEIVTTPQEPTLSDATTGRIEDGSVTLGYCRALVDRFVLVSEREIKETIVTLLEHHHFAVEGAAAVAVAGFIRLAAEWRDRRVAIICCGGNISVTTLNKILLEESARS